jgi:hypothetical protein
MLTKIELLKIFRTKLIDFLDALREKLPKENDIVILRVYLAEQIPIETILQIFAKRILPYEEMVNARDERFILEQNDLFEGLKRDKVHYFKTLWTSPTFTQEDKNMLWEWFKVFLKLAKMYTTHYQP